MEQNLDFLGKSMDAILLSRRDTFKEQITRAYANKEQDLEYYRKRCEEMEEHEKLYQKSVKDRENLVLQNQALQKELAELKASSAIETASLRKSVI